MAWDLLEKLFCRVPRTNRCWLAVRSTARRGTGAILMDWLSAFILRIERCSKKKKATEGTNDLTEHPVSGSSHDLLSSRHENPELRIFPDAKGLSRLVAFPTAMRSQKVRDFLIVDLDEAKG